MPRKLSRKARTEQLLKSFLRARKARVKRDRKRRARERRTLQLLKLYGDSSSSSSDSSISVDVTSLSSECSQTSDSSDSSSDSSVDSSSTSTTSDSDDKTMDTISTSSSQTSEDLGADHMLIEMDTELDGMPDLVSMGWRLSDDDTDSEWKSSSSGDDADSEPESEINDSDDGEEEWQEGPNITKWVRESITEMYAQRYEEPRDKSKSRPPPQVHHCLEVTKIENPEEFRELLRVTPQTFDKLVAKIENDPVFFNNSNNPQLPVEQQLAIALYRFGHDGNAAGQASVGRWAGAGKGSSALHTKRVMTAILREEFMNDAVYIPAPGSAAKAEAEDWVEAHSCRAWRHGWLFVDGTLVPLFDRPHWYGESYFDRKCNYSMNVQVRSPSTHISALD